MKVIDMHCDTLYKMNKAKKEKKSIELKENDLHISIEKMKKSHYMAQNFAIFTYLKNPLESITHVHQMIDLFYQEIEKNKDDIQIAYSYQDIINHEKMNKMSAILTLEEGDVVNQNLSILRNYYRLGVRMITLTWNFKNHLGYPSYSQDHLQYNDKGLTNFGIEYIKECEKLGIIIDVSHLSDEGFYDVYRYTTKPFVASHSNVRQLCHHPRNLSDDMIKKIAKRGGVIGINYAIEFLDEKDKQSKIDNIIKHIVYIRDLVGIDYIGLGSDYDGIEGTLELRDCSYLSLLEKAMYQYGFKKEDIEKVFYKNVLRVYREILK